jgi:alkyl sulfatase BDS1-like metallo-beta-lactamase superfamily hydrolase
VTQVFDYRGNRIDGPRGGTAKIAINWNFTDTHETIVSTLQHGALTSITGKKDSNAGVTVITSRRVLEPIILGQGRRLTLWLTAQSL